MCPRNVSDTTQTSYTFILFLVEFQFYEGHRFLTFWVMTCGKLRRLILTRHGSSAQSRLFGKLGFISQAESVPLLSPVLGFCGWFLEEVISNIAWEGSQLEHRAPRVFSSSTGAICTKIGQCHVWPGTGQGGPPVTLPTRGTQNMSHENTSSLRWFGLNRTSLTKVL